MVVEPLRLGRAGSGDRYRLQRRHVARRVSAPRRATVGRRSGAKSRGIHRRQRHRALHGLFTAATAKEIVAKWGRGCADHSDQHVSRTSRTRRFCRGLKRRSNPAAPSSSRCTTCSTSSSRWPSTRFTTSMFPTGRLAPMKRLFEAHGMTIVDAERVPLHHGQLRVHVQRARRRERCGRASIEILAGGERPPDSTSFETYDRVRRAREKDQDRICTKLSATFAERRPASGGLRRARQRQYACSDF